MTTPTRQDQIGDDSNAAAPAVPLQEGLMLLWSYARPHLRTITFGATLGLFATAMALATPMATKWVLDSLEEDIQLRVPVMLLIILLVIGTIAGLGQRIILGRLAEHIVLDARSSLIKRFFRAKLEQIQRFRIGELVTRVTSDTVLLREAAASSIVQFTNGTVSLIGTIALMAVLDWPLLLMTLVALAMVGAMFALLLPKIGHAEKQAQNSLGQLGASLEGSIRALRTVKSSRAENREINRVTARAHESAQHSIRSVRISALIWTVAGGGMQLAIIVILGLGAWRVSIGELAVSTLVAFLLYAFNILDPITNLASAFTQVQSGLAAAARIQETGHLELEDTDSHSTRVGIQNVDDPVLALRNVTAHYEDAALPALHQITLEIPRIGHTALVGPSGAGKTTIFSLLLRFIDPTSGQAELDGVAYEELSIDTVRSRISYVEQETPIIPGTVRENVLFRADEAIESDAWKALKSVRLDDKIRTLSQGIDTIVVDTNLSGGERQRLAVSRALVGQPDVLLLDEVTAQLDGTTESAIQEVISNTARSGAVVTIAHRLSTILDADQIVLLEGGRIRDRGTHSELLARDRLYQDFVAALRIDTETHPTNRS